MAALERLDATKHRVALVRALESMGADGTDTAARRLAMEYASQLDDDPAALVKIGSHYLAVLAALGLTPAARAALAKGGSGDGTPAETELDRMRRARASAR